MAKLTLLEIVQDIHNALNLDTVDSIADTVESLQVAQSAKTVYFEVIGRRDWPHLMRLGRMLSYTADARKTTLVIPEAVNRVEWVTYNDKKLITDEDRYVQLTYLFPEVFLEKLNRNRVGTNTVLTAISDDISVLVRTDKTPEYWTSFNDVDIVLDSYSAALETTVQGIHTQAMFYKTPAWLTEDTFVPDLPVEAFPMYVAELKSVCSIEINEIPNPKAEQAASRHSRRMTLHSWKAHDGYRSYDYGRKGPGSSSNRLLGK